MDMIVMARVLGGVVKEESVQVLVMANTSDITNAVGQPMQIIDGRIVATMVRTKICHRVEYIINISILVVPFKLLWGVWE